MILAQNANIDQLSGFERRVVLAWLRRTIYQIDAGNWWRGIAPSFNLMRHPGKATMIYRRWGYIIDKVVR